MTPEQTVFLVDDEADLRKALTRLLRAEGHTVVAFASAEEFLRAQPPTGGSCLILDVSMPGIDGFETCRRLKRERLLGHLPVIFMTGLSETEHVVQGLAAGGVDYVPKPIVVEELLARIRVHLANARSAQGSRVALDAAGRFLLATDRLGQVLWCTPKARQLLGELFPGQDPHPSSLPQDLIDRLLHARGTGGASPGPQLIEAFGRKVEFSMLSPLGPNELLFRLSEIIEGGDEQLLQRMLGLTGREADVLLWISRGKSNREIGEILSISPRTVNKHLEQVFVKLGVENRASAAARAVRTLARQA